MTTMSDFSENPNYPITELEVFVGFIVNKSGVQTSRQRDKSIKLKDEFDRISLGFSRVISNYRARTELDDKAAESEADDDVRSAGMDANAVPAGPCLDGLAMAIACLHVTCEPVHHSRHSTRHRSVEHSLESFRVIAATELGRELHRLEGMSMDLKATDGGT